MKPINQGRPPEHVEPAAWRRHMAEAEIGAANAVPVIGVWFLGWQAWRPIFFYWLDGLLALWGLGVVAAAVSIRETPFKATGAKLRLAKAAVVVLALAILSVPSVFTACYLFGTLHQPPEEILSRIFSGYGVWFSLLVVVGSYIAQTIGEIRWRPAVTLKQSGKERANLFIHRTLLMGLLVLWDSWSPPSRLLLGLYVLAVACLYTSTQLYPERYLRLIGFPTRTSKTVAKATENTATKKKDRPTHR
ncbi:hypothetical protein JT06_15675 [Desulfobulbus sp. Tol-SR]|nr:hypothetical protein JT06_15675 [Desulfobulbus sp. Tol-SR]